jgi:transcriptional regulator with XRE-family HTH domain
VSTNVHSRAVQKATDLAGGRQALADRVGISRADIDAWLAGERRPSLPELLRIVEIILDETEEAG